MSEKNPLEEELTEAPKKLQESDKKYVGLDPLGEMRRTDPTFRAIDNAVIATFLAGAVFAGGYVVGLKSDSAKREGAALAFKTDNYTERAEVVAKELQEVQEKYGVSLEGAIKLSLLGQQQSWTDFKVLRNIDPSRQYSKTEIQEMFHEAINKETEEIKWSFANLDK
jgi:hypothetical protein